MKKIETLLHAHHWDYARAQLSALGIRGTLREVKTFGYTPPARGVYRGTAYTLDVTSQLELSLVVRDEQVEGVLAVLEASAPCGEVLLTTLDDALRFESTPPAVFGQHQQAPSTAGSLFVSPVFSGR